MKFSQYESKMITLLLMIFEKPPKIFENKSTIGIPIWRLQNFRYSPPKADLFNGWI